MSNKTSTFIIGWIFLVSSFFFSYGVNVICASIFFSAHYIVEEIQKLNKK